MDTALFLEGFDGFEIGGCLEDAVGEPQIEHGLRASPIQRVLEAGVPDQDEHHGRERGGDRGRHQDDRHHQPAGRPSAPAHASVRSRR